MHIFKKAALAAALVTASLSANAAETHITILADVDPTLALLQADGSPLPDAIKMVHKPGTGLDAWKRQVRIYSNDIDKDIEVRLINEPVLIGNAAGTPSVPLKVSLNNRELGLAATDYLAADLFDGALPGASVAMPLEIAQKTPGAITVADSFQGMVSIAMKQKTASP
ncbi:MULTISPECIES: CS1 type fimbrial major subunit [Stenotrophomonas]|uniref:CS1 type fimbrial major subunit n=1 Tax=Stenotrophomonas TaxID=40323 RepID=UPI000D53DC69|nr:MULTISPECIES: CS1 type fimbrial major subunit [Stenotrophomonas]AWH22584.1 fimbrial protein [Stenotrophomonas sp. ZAC14D2_NAIMI4_6]